ncbi:MAG: hypothetical protein JRE16_10905 [Deltaproteobacteria bacterium]|nr:hypothetical protein [Deltaproteobacteria bacterium]
MQRLNCFQIMPVLYVLSFLHLLTSPVWASTDQRQIESAVSSIRALDSARQTVLRDFDQMNASQQEFRDIQNFVVYLNTRIAAYCEDLAEAGKLSLIEELPCPADAPSGSMTEKQTEDVPQESAQEGAIAGSAQTPEEQNEALQDQFLQSLGAFDDMLAKEEVKVASRVPRQRETGGRRAGSGSSGTGSNGGQAGSEGSGAAGSSAGSMSGQSPASGQGEQGNGREGGGMSQQQTGESATGGGSSDGGAGQGAASGQQKGSTAGVSQGRLPPPEDDDIVARQLREAAEKEQDPELKEKLWEEYWKYKGASGKRG